MEVRPGRWTHGHRRAQRASTSIGLQRPGAAEDLAADPGTQSVVLPAAAVGGQVRSAQMEIIDPTHSLPPRLSADGPSAVPPRGRSGAPGNPHSRSFIVDLASVSGSVEQDSTADEGPHHARPDNPGDANRVTTPPMGVAVAVAVAAWLLGRRVIAPGFRLRRRMVFASTLEPPILRYLGRAPAPGPIGSQLHVRDPRACRSAGRKRPSLT